MDPIEKSFDIIKTLSEIKHRTRIILTFAHSLDGKISITGKQLKISSQESLCLTHCLRASNDGILVGINTVLIDNPSLNTRLPKELDLKSPVPIVVDSNLRLPLECKFISRNPIILCKPIELCDDQKMMFLKEKGATLIHVFRNNFSAR